MGLVSLYTQEMLRSLVVVFPVYAVLRIAFLAVRRVRPTVAREALLAVCVMYGIGLASQTLLPRGHLGVEAWGEYAQIALSPYHSFNIVPLHTIRSYAFTQNDQVSNWGSIATMNLLANVLLFAPLGFLLPLVRRGVTRLRHVLVIGAAASIVIETVQYFIGRSADVDDVILNVIGACVGYAIVAAVRKMRISAPLSEVVEPG